MLGFIQGLLLIIIEVFIFFTHRLFVKQETKSQ